MKVGIVVAMEEEFSALKNIFNDSHLVEKSPYKVYEAPYASHSIYGVISKIGKAASSSATTLLITKYNCDIIINIGSCGGLNIATLGSIILSNKAGYYDVDVSAFGYKMGQLPNQPEIFVSSSNHVSFDNLSNALKNLSPYLVNGTIITGDSFINDKAKISDIKSIYPNIVAVEMEAASIAQICNHYDKDFILIKKVSDMADHDASSSFKEEIGKMEEKTSKVIFDTLNQILS